MQAVIQALQPATSNDLHISPFSGALAILFKEPKQCSRIIESGDSKTYLHTHPKIMSIDFNTSTSYIATSTSKGALHPSSTLLDFAVHHILSRGSYHYFPQPQRLFDRILCGEDIIEFFQRTTFRLGPEEKYNNCFNEDPRREKNVCFPSQMSILQSVQHL